MKTLLVCLLTLLLVAAAIVLDSHRLDAAGWLSSLTAAGLFAVAYTDGAPRRRAPAAVRPSDSPATCSAPWVGGNSCVLCAGVSS